MSFYLFIFSRGITFTTKRVVEKVAQLKQSRLWYRFYEVDSFSIVVVMLLGVYGIEIINAGVIYIRC